MQMALGLGGIIAAVFGGKAEEAPDQALVEQTVEAMVDEVDRRVRASANYKVKLGSGVRATIAYLRALARQLPEEPLLLSRSAWAHDPYLNAFFATADDVPAFMGRSKELREFFERAENARVEEAYAFLGMKMEERTIFAPKVEDGVLKQDVAQVSVSFSMHRLYGPAASLMEARQEVGRRIFRRLAQVALQQIIALDDKAVELNQRKGYLGARLRLLALAKDGMAGIVEDPATIDRQVREVERELKATVNDYIEAKSSLATLDAYLDRINDVLRNPEQHVSLECAPLRIDRMGIKVDWAESVPSHDLSLTRLRVGPMAGVIAIVKCLRAELPPKEDLLANAERYL
jgi:hypothetical protein